MRTFQKTQVTSGGLIFLGPGHFGLNIRNLLQYRHSEQELLKLSDIPLKNSLQNKIKLISTQLGPENANLPKNKNDT